LSSATNPVSALDVSIRAQIINLLLELKETLGLSYIMISHDLGVVEHMSDRVAVMYLGRIVETGDWREIFERPAHPYTQTLIAAIPDPLRRAPLATTKGELPNPLNPPEGCAFSPRCRYAEAVCHREPGQRLKHVPTDTRSGAGELTRSPVRTASGLDRKYLARRTRLPWVKCVDFGVPADISLSDNPGKSGRHGNCSHCGTSLAFA
jgi:oligopeptide/dipeptide ABC transporter ATP-binding protein